MQGGKIWGGSLSLPVSEIQETVVLVSVSLLTGWGDLAKLVSFPGPHDLKDNLMTRTLSLLF